MGFELSKLFGRQEDDSKIAGEGLDPSSAMHMGSADKLPQNIQHNVAPLSASNIANVPKYPLVPRAEAPASSVVNKDPIDEALKSITEEVGPPPSPKDVPVAHEFQPNPEHVGAGDKGPEVAVNDPTTPFVRTMPTVEVKDPESKSTQGPLVLTNKEQVKAPPAPAPVEPAGPAPAPSHSRTVIKGVNDKVPPTAPPTPSTPPISLEERLKRAVNPQENAGVQEKEGTAEGSVDEIEETLDAIHNAAKNAKKEPLRSKYDFVHNPAAPKVGNAFGEKIIPDEITPKEATTLATLRETAPVQTNKPVEKVKEGDVSSLLSKKVVYGAVRDSMLKKQDEVLGTQENADTATDSTEGRSEEPMPPVYGKVYAARTTIDTGKATRAELQPMEDEAMRIMQDAPQTEAPIESAEHSLAESVRELVDTKDLSEEQLIERLGALLDAAKQKRQRSELHDLIESLLTQDHSTEAREALVNAQENLEKGESCDNILAGINEALRKGQEAVSPQARESVAASVEATKKRGALKNTGMVLLGLAKGTLATVEKVAVPAMIATAIGGLALGTGVAVGAAVAWTAVAGGRALTLRLKGNEAQ